MEQRRGSVRDGRPASSGLARRVAPGVPWRPARRARIGAGSGPALLAALVDSCADAIVGLDLRGRITSWNGAAERLFGHRASWMLGRSILRVVPPELQSEQMRLLARIARGESIQDVETERVRRDGSRAAVAVSMSPIRDPRGRVVGTSQVAHPLTDRATLGRTLQESEQRIQQALRASRSFTFEWALQTDRVRRSASCGDILRLAGDEAVDDTGQRFFQRVHPDDRARFVALVSCLSPDAPNYSAEYRVARGDGSVATLEEVGHGSFDADGVLVWLVGVSTDITERRRQETLLRLARSRLETALEASQVVVFQQDLELRYTWIHNPALGYAAQQVVGHRDADLFARPEDAARTESIKRSVIETGVARREEVRVTLGDLVRFYDLVVQPDRDADGRIVGVNCAAVDVTERRQAEAALREADRNKDEFLAMLAHELRGPLAPLRNGLRVLRSVRSDAALTAATQAMMERQITHLVRLVDDLLDVSRISSGRIELRSERVTLAAVVEAALEASRPAVEAGGHALDVELPDEPVWLDADGARLSQVLANLLNNAAKYTAPSGHIALRASLQTGSVVVAVSDTGVGIEADMLERVFGLFTQVDRTLDRAQGGLGIGLSLARRLVEMHGGTLEAASEGLGRGATFTMRLPRSRVAGAAPTAGPRIGPIGETP
jgi:PAS domain S-box-containing protein